MYIAVKQETATSLTALLTKESNSHAIKSAAVVSHNYLTRFPTKLASIGFHERDLGDRVACTD